MDINEEKITVVIPAYNEEKAISTVIATLMKISIVNEIIVIDDGSVDSTKQKAIESGVKVISHRKNIGYGASLKTGIINSKNNVIALFDADGQHNADDLVSLNKYVRDHDMISGVRQKKSHSPLWRKPGKIIINMLANYLAGHKIPDLNCGLRLVKRDLIIPYLELFPDKFSFSTTSMVFFLKEGFKVKFVPINTRKRIGESSLRVIHGFDTIILVLRMITLFEPLKIFLPVSTTFFSLGIISGSFDFINHRRIGTTSLFLGITSILVFFFGLISDQIATIRKEIK
jgi:glycosyltransferase involved in cell wall biosynthesis